MKVEGAGEGMSILRGTEQMQDQWGQLTGMTTVNK